MATLIKNCKKKKLFIEEEILWKVFAQLVEALHYCHKKGKKKVLHRDLKPGNVFFGRNQTVKLGDFGLSREMGEESTFARTHVGTPYYMSPEQIANKSYNEKSDVWSLACVMYEMASLSPPFRATNHLQLAELIKKGKIESLSEHYSSDVFNLIKVMMHQDPNKRPNTEDLICHPRIVEAQKPDSELKMRNHRSGSDPSKMPSKVSKTRKELDHREDAIRKREIRVENREEELEKKEKELKELEANIKREMELLKKLKA